MLKSEHVGLAGRKAGSVVLTKTWGEAVVLDITGGGNLVCLFEDGSERTMAPAYCQSTGRKAALPAKKRKKVKVEPEIDEVDDGVLVAGSNGASITIVQDEADEHTPDRLPSEEDEDGEMYVDYGDEPDAGEETGEICERHSNNCD